MSKKIKVKCFHCGKEFERAKSLVGGNNYCNIDCYKKSKKRKNTNKIIVTGDCSKLIISYKGNNIITLIDTDDIDIISQYNWHYVSGYLQSSYKDRTRLHRLIMNCPKGKIIDHIDRNTLNNRKSNLRICSVSENNKNTSFNRENSSGYRGISFHKQTNKWRVRISKDNKCYTVGSFLDINEAIDARIKAERKIWGFTNANI